MIIVFPNPRLRMYFLNYVQVRNPQTGICLDTMAKSFGFALGVSPCHGMGGNQVLLYMSSGIPEV